MNRRHDLASLIGIVLLFTSACGKKTEPETGAPEPLAAKDQEPSEVIEKKSESQQPAGPTGSIQGLVKLLGEAPTMPRLQRGSDPACDKSEALAETIMVDEQAGLANVVVRIKPGTVPAWTPSAPIIVDQVECMYRPRVQGGVRGQTVQILNSDTTTHNVHARYLALGERVDTDTLINLAQPAGVKLSFELGDEPVAKLRCNNHSWMQGYVVVSDNPYYGVTGSDGRFEIANVPVGEHQVELWHEFYGLKEATLTVEADASATLDFSYDAVADNPRGNN